jgi:anti-sigma regulatory factor (Ser/Thr protein kinase)
MAPGCIEFKFPSQFTYIQPIQAFIGKLTEQLGFCQTHIYNVQLIIDELCSNAIEHGSQMSTSDIELQLLIDSDQLEILIRDKGKENQQNWLTTGRVDEVRRDMAPDRVRGHGLYIANELADHLEMHPNSLGGTDVRVSFNLPESKST